VVLDEPTSGLDPLVQETFYELVAEATERGGTVFLSSHVLSEVEEICERAAVVREGRLAQVIKLSDLHEIRLRRVEIAFARTPDAQLLRQVPGVEEVAVDGTSARCLLRGSFGPLVDALAGMGVLNLTSHEPTLEETFLQIYRSGRPEG
jgi:ABC-2 type transport system ATP-binding protein